MAGAPRSRAAVAGLVLALSLSACGLLPEERGQVPVGANLERLATGPGGHPRGVAVRDGGRLIARTGGIRHGRRAAADRTNRGHQRTHQTPPAPGVYAWALQPAAARP